jgi:PAS domain S-box-containing protein
MGSFFAFFYAFTEVMMWQSDSIESATLWSRIGSIWPFFIVLVVHFVLVFTNNKWLKNKLTYPILYIPAFIFWIIDASTHLINAIPVMQTWGYEDFPAGTITSYISVVWAAFLPVLAFALCFRYYQATTDQKRKQQTKFITIGLGIPIFTYLITNMVLPAIGIDTPNLGHFAVMFFSGLVGYAIIKFDLFTIDAALAAENIVSMMPDSLILADMNGKILKVNKQILNFLGYSQDELIGKSIAKLGLQEIRFEGFLKDLAQQRAINDWELKLATKSGGEKHVLFSASLVRSKTGQDVGITCIIHDITERNQMQAKLQEYNTRLKDLVKERTAQLEKAQRFATIGELAGMVGHDLRNPLAGIKNAVYLLRKKQADFIGDSGIQMLNTIDQAIEHSNSIINDLLDYSRDLHLETEECSTKSLINYVILSLKVPSNIKLQELTLDYTIKMDENKINRVFVNLVKNAFDAMPNGGKLEITSRQNGGYVDFAFADTGTGMSEDIMAKIFTPLFTTKAQGMGLGLAICKRMIEAHNGKISVQSKVNQGTTFTVSLPHCL